MALSVGRTGSLGEEAAWAWGDTHVGEPRQRLVRARGDLVVSQLQEVTVDSVTLGVEPDEPPPLHANVTGWPHPDRKEVRKALAQQMAAAAKLVSR